jgi:hypothetical protein
MSPTNHLSKDLLQQAESLLNQKKEIRKIEFILDEAGYDAESIRLALSSIKKQKHAREFKSGITLLITGALILLVSCIVTVWLFHNNISLSFFMYLTSGLGIIVCFLGFKKIFD